MLHEKLREIRTELAELQQVAINEHEWESLEKIQNALASIKEAENTRMGQVEILGEWAA